MLKLAMLQLIFICGVVYGLVTLILEVRQKPLNKHQIGLSIAIILLSSILLLSNYL